MQKISVNDLIEYDDTRFLPKTLVNEPGYRMVLLNLRANQSVPEHANPGIVTVYAIGGHITFYEGPQSCELRAGEVVRIPAGAPHRIEAHEDSALFVLATKTAGAPQEDSVELDLRTVPLPQRHPLVFQTFDALAVGSSFRLINDHDPIPLSRQIDAMRRGQASWEYIERGPEVFHIRIRRTAPPDASQSPFNPPEARLTGIGKA